MNEGYSAKNYDENSSNNGKRRLEELFKITWYFDGIVANGSGESYLER